MATLTRATTLSAEMSRCMFAPQTKAPAGVAIVAGDVVYVKAADGLMYPADGTAATEPATFWGIAPKAFAAGESAMAFGIGAKIAGYLATAVAIGTKLFVSATAGSLDNAATTGGTVAVARVVGSPNGGATSKDIEIILQAT